MAIKHTRCRVKNLDKSFSGSRRAKSARWQLIIERDVPNPDFVPRSEGLDANGSKVSDTRSAKQKRKTKRETLTKMYEGEPVVESKAKSAAEAWMASVNANIERPDEAGMTVADYVDAFLADHEVNDSTKTGYLSAAKHIRKEFAETRLGDLDAAAIEGWLDGLKKAGYSERTRYADYKVLRMACKHASRREGPLAFNPCDDVRKGKKPKQGSTKANAHINSLTIDAPEGCEPTFDKHRRLLDDMEPTPLVTAASIATYTGMRCGEVCGLRWRDVDEAGRVIHVRSAVGMKGRLDGKRGGAYLKDAKTEDSARDIPISKVLSSKLAERRDLMLMARRRA